MELNGSQIEFISQNKKKKFWNNTVSHGSQDGW